MFSFCKWYFFKSYANNNEKVVKSIFQEQERKLGPIESMERNVCRYKKN